MTRLTCLAAAAVMTASAATGEDWPQWRGPERTGISAETGLLKQWPDGGPKEAWAIQTPGVGFAAPAVVGDTLYITGNEGPKKRPRGVLYAIGTDGKIRWKLDYGPEWGQSHQMSRTTPTIRDGRGYLISGMGRVVCFDAEKGREIWAVDMGERFGGRNVKWGLAESPLVVDGKVICHPGGEGAALAAVSAADGKTVWTTKGLSDKASYCSPIAVDVGGTKLILSQTDSHIVGVDLATGEVYWKVLQKNRWAVHPNTPVYFDRKVFISSGYGYGCQLLQLSADGKKAEVLWKHKHMDNHFQGMLYVDGRLYGSGSKGPLYCLDPAEGKVLYTVDAVRKAAILYADGRIYGYDEKGGNVWLVEIGPGGGQVRGQFTVKQGSGPHWAHPVVADGVLYIRHGAALLAYDISAR